MKQPFASSAKSSIKEHIDDIVLLRHKNDELSKVTTLERDVSELKASNSSLRLQLTLDHARGEM